MSEEENLYYHNLTFTVPDWQKEMLSKVWLPVILNQPKQENK